MLLLKLHLNILTLYAPDCYDKLGTYAQMNPPLRTKEHYDRLWIAVKNNIVDVLGSDHAPHSKKIKIKNIQIHPQVCQECKLSFLLC